jgi:hypothetical protein
MLLRDTILEMDFMYLEAKFRVSILTTFIHQPLKQYILAI